MAEGKKNDAGNSFPGRGGQSTVVASILPAKAYFYAGYYVQTFP
jgi:Pyruvate/2-oxoacid:ferredoxin oxidoreductase gamma subunit